MLCDRCKMKEAKIYYTEITGGKKIEQHLCEDCAAELTSFQKEIPLESLLSGLLGIGSGSSRERVCQVCGMSYQEFQKVGKRIQGATAHTGKIAASWQQESFKQQEKEEQPDPLLLKKALEEAIAKEEYEEAARLRDEIRSIKASKEKGGCSECQKNK